MAKERKEVKKLSLEAALAAINKQYGAASIFHGSENISIQVESWSSGCLAFDSVLGCGVPKGRIIEVSGPEGSGKTAFSASIIGYWQEKYNATCAFIDGEQTASPTWFRSLSVNWDKLLYSAPDTLEQVLDTIDTLASTGQVDLIVYDSIAALPSISEAEKSAGDVNVAALSKVLTSALRKLTPVLAKNKCTVIFINQLREKIGAFSPGGGIPTTTPGGRALKHAASLRLEMKRAFGDGSQIKEDGVIVGHKVAIKCKKNKLSSAQGAEASFMLHYTKGVDRVQDAITTAETIGIIERPSNVMYVYKDLKVKGHDNFMAALREDSKLLADLVKATQDKMSSGTVFVQEPELAESDERYHLQWLGNSWTVLLLDEFVTLRETANLDDKLSIEDQIKRLTVLEKALEFEKLNLPDLNYNQKRLLYSKLHELESGSLVNPISHSNDQFWLDDAFVLACPHCKQKITKKDLNSPSQVLADT